MATDTTPENKTEAQNSRRETVMINGAPFTEDAVLAMPKGARLWKMGVAQNKRQARRERIRTRIRHDVGDTATLLGTTADVAQINAAISQAVLSALDGSNNFGTFQSALKKKISAMFPAQKGQPDVYAKATDFVESVQSGDIVLTSTAKTSASVITDMGAQASAVSGILKADADAL